MSSKRKPANTGLFRTKEDIEQEESPSDRDMSPEPQTTPEVRLTRASFDLREDQIHDLRDLKNTLARSGTKRKMSDLAQEAVDLLLDKYR